MVSMCPRCTILIYLLRKVFHPMAMIHEFIHFLHALLSILVYTAISLGSLYILRSRNFMRQPQVMFYVLRCVLVVGCSQLPVRLKTLIASAVGQQVCCQSPRLTSTVQFFFQFIGGGCEWVKFHKVSMTI